MSTSENWNGCAVKETHTSGQQSANDSSHFRVLFPISFHPCGHKIAVKLPEANEAPERRFTQLMPASICAREWLQCFRLFYWLGLPVCVCFFISIRLFNTVCCPHFPFLYRHHIDQLQLSIIIPTVPSVSIVDLIKNEEYCWSSL